MEASLGLADSKTPALSTPSGIFPWSKLLLELEDSSEYLVVLEQREWPRKPRNLKINLQFGTSLGVFLRPPPKKLRRTCSGGFRKGKKGCLFL